METGREAEAMKLDPGFPNHWKTERMMDKLGADGVVALLRLWSNAQISHRFTGLHFTPKRLAMETKWKGDENLLFAVLTDPEAPWLDADPEGTFTIHGFAEHQHQVVKLWENGKKGGRPKKVSPDSSKDSYTSSCSSSSPICKPNENHMVSRDERGADGYELIPTGNRPQILELEKRVQRLRPEWKIPFMRTEQELLLENARCLDALTDDEWKTLGCYLHARIPQGVPKWQPDNRKKFLETCSDVVGHALRWKQKSTDRAPVRIPAQAPAQTEEDKAAIAEFLKSSPPKPKA
jgi:hypothetical protein